MSMHAQIMKCVNLTVIVCVGRLQLVTMLTVLAHMSLASLKKKARSQSRNQRSLRGYRYSWSESWTYRKKGRRFAPPWPLTPRPSFHIYRRSIMSAEARWGAAFLPERFLPTKATMFSARARREHSLRVNVERPRNPFAERPTPSLMLTSLNYGSKIDLDKARTTEAQTGLQKAKQKCESPLTQKKQHFPTIQKSNENPRPTKQNSGTKKAHP